MIRLLGVLGLVGGRVLHVTANGAPAFLRPAPNLRPEVAVRGVIEAHLARVRVAPAAVIADEVRIASRLNFVPKPIGVEQLCGRAAREVLGIPRSSSNRLDRTSQWRRSGSMKVRSALVQLKLSRELELPRNDPIAVDLGSQWIQQSSKSLRGLSIRVVQRSLLSN
jgi:hypothetical protein